MKTTPTGISMGLNHFAYLVHAPQNPRTSPEHLELLAKTASKRFIDERIPLNDTIKKLAEDNDLNGAQIERVCEMANMATHQVLFPRAPDKVKVAFPLADAKAVKAEGGRSVPAAPSMGDYERPPSRSSSGGPDLASLMGVDPSKVHHGLTQEPERKTVIIMLAKKAAARKSLYADTLVSAMHAETAEKLAFQAVKQSILGGQSFANLLRASAACGLDKVALELLPAFEKKLIADTHGEVRNRLIKTAIQKAPEEYISQDLGGRTVVNGANPVMVSLDVVQKKNGVVKNNLANLLRIDDEIKVYKQKLRELS